MTFVAPFAFGLAALAVPIVVLYMLRSKRARTTVSSVLLWDSGDQSVSASAPWQPLRLSLLLLLQLLALLLLVAAIARPARRTSAPLAAHTVLILDASASMQADDQGRSRLESAKRRALRAVEELGPGRRISVIEAGPRARVVVSGSTDRTTLVEAIAAIRGTDGSAEAAEAFALGASLETADVPTIIHFYSDGGVRTEDRVRAPATLLHVPVGGARGNVALSRLTLVPRGGGYDAFIHLSNSGTVRIDARIAVEAEGRRLAVRPVRLEPETATDVTISLPGSSADSFVARLEDVRAAPGTAGDPAPTEYNALRVDDEARTVLDARSRLRVLLMTPGNVFLESLLRSLPGVELTTSATAVPARGATLAVYDRVAPPRRLETASLVIASPAGAPGVTVGGTRTAPVVTFVQPREPVLEHVDLSRLAIRRAQRISAPDLRTLVGAADDPMLAFGIPGGRRLAYLAFDLRESNLPVQVAFPLLFGNVVDWLVEGEGPERASLVAGDPLPLRVPGRTTRIVVDTPSGGRIEQSATQPSFDETDRAGFYRVRYYAGGALLGRETFAVNVPTLESSLVVKPITGSLERRGRGIGRLAGLRPFGPGLLAVALAILMAEWWVAHGRPTASRRWRARERAA